MPKAPKVYLTKSEYERDHGKGSFERLAAANINPLKASTPASATPYAQPARGGPGRGGNRSGGPMGFGQRGGGRGNGGRQQQRGGRGGGRGFNSNRNNIAMMEQDEDFEEEEAYVPPVRNPAGGGMRGRMGGRNATAVATAKVLVAAGNHPKKNEIKQLLQAYEKGWVPEMKFSEALSELIV